MVILNVICSPWNCGAAHSRSFYLLSSHWFVSLISINIQTTLVSNSSHQLRVVSLLPFLDRDSVCLSPFPSYLPLFSDFLTYLVACQGFQHTPWTYRVRYCWVLVLWVESLMSEHISHLMNLVLSIVALPRRECTSSTVNTLWSLALTSSSIACLTIHI